MKMNENQKKSVEKRAYVKPSISEVKLRPEESVLGNCKVSGAGGPLSSSCASPTQCNALLT